MNDIDEKLDEILKGVMDDATLWYIERITEKQYWDTHQKAKQEIKQLISDITTEAKIDELTAVINKQVSSESEKEFCDWLNSRRYRLAQPLSKQDDN